MSKIENRFDKPVRRAARIGVSGALGLVIGSFAGTGAGLVTGDVETGLEIGVKTAAAISTASFFLGELRNTINYAEGPDRPLLHRLKAALAAVQGGLACGVPGAIVSYSYDNPGWLVGAVAFGALGGYSQFSENFREQPDLVYPDGSSITEITADTPRIYLETRLPRMYRSGSLKDIIEFREANKKGIVAWAGDLPKTDRDVPTQLTAQPSSPVNAVFITRVRHFPAEDPKEGDRMHIRDRQQVKDGEDALANPLKDSAFFWPFHPTNLEDGRPLIHFSKDKWEGFKSKSWERDVVVLAQYQTTKAFSMEYKPEDVVDRFWIIDILGEGIVKRGKRVLADRPVLIPMPNQVRI